MDVIEQIVANLNEFRSENDSEIKEKLLYILQSDIKYLGKINGLHVDSDKINSDKSKIIINNLINEKKILKNQLINKTENSYLVIENILKKIQKDLRLFNSFYVRNANIRKNLVVEIELIPSVDVYKFGVENNPLELFVEDEDFTHILASDENINLITNEISKLYNFGNINELSLNYISNTKVLKNIKFAIPLQNICDYYDKVGH